MTEKLLINVAHEETRVALVESGRLTNFEIVTLRADNNKGNIYKGIVHRVNASLQAAFVDYGADKQGFLPVGEIHTRYWPKHLQGKKVSIQEVLQQGQEIMVQIVKDEIGQKGATLTTFVSLAGRSLALEADSDKAGISRRVSDSERARLKKVMNTLEVPEGFGAIMRTAAADQGEDDIKENQKYLMTMWNQLQDRFRAMKGPGLVHQERSLPLRFIRDYVAGSVDEILIDEREMYEEVRNFCTVTAPELLNRVKLYDDPRPLFSRYQVEDQIDDLFARRIELPSGGSIVIDQAEALVAIDVNSGRVKTDDIEDTATKTNLEAAAEIARQLKIRDRGGLIVVDFIDMRDKDNIRKVEDAVRDGFKNDKAKVKFSKISEFGLMEISRQRLQSSVVRGSFSNCPSCGGTGLVRSVESSSLYLLRRMKETLIRGSYQHVEARMPVPIANYLLNQKRRELVDLERQTGTGIEVVAEHNCPPMKAWIELLTRVTSQARRPRRVVQEVDLVRSEVEKRDLEDGEHIHIEQLESEAAAPSQFAEEKEELDKANKQMEADLAQSRAQDIAQREADESLRREAEARAEAEKKLAEAEKIRALDDARRKSLTLWGRIKAFFYGLPPIEERAASPSEGERRRERDKDREKERERDRDRRDRERDDRRNKRRDRDDKKVEGDKKEGGEQKREDKKDQPQKQGQRDQKQGQRDQKQGQRDGQPKPQGQGQRDGQPKPQGQRDGQPKPQGQRDGQQPRPQGQGGQGPRPEGEDRGRRRGRGGREREEVVAAPAEAGEPPQFASIVSYGNGLLPFDKPAPTTVAPIPGDAVLTPAVPSAPVAAAEPAPKPKLPKGVGVIDLRAGAPKLPTNPSMPAVPAEPKPESKPEPKLESKPEPKAEAKPEPKPEPRVAAPSAPPAIPVADNDAAASNDDGEDEGDEGGDEGGDVSDAERKRRRGRRGGRGRRRNGETRPDGAPAEIAAAPANEGPKE